MFTATFKNAQGDIITDGLFKAKEGNLNTQEGITLNIDRVNYNNSTNDQSTVDYEMYYWTNQAAFDAGSAPYNLQALVTFSSRFNFDNVAAYDGLSLEAKIDKHCQDVTLAAMPAT